MHNTTGTFDGFSSPFLQRLHASLNDRFNFFFNLCHVNKRPLICKKPTNTGFLNWVILFSVCTALASGPKSVLRTEIRIGPAVHVSRE